jgi:hypothetical protein
MLEPTDVRDILEKLGVAGDFMEDCEESEVTSEGDAEFFQPLEADLFLREKSPMVAMPIGEPQVPIWVFGRRYTARQDSRWERQTKSWESRRRGVWRTGGTGVGRCRLVNADCGDGTGGGRASEQKKGSNRTLDNYSERGEGYILCEYCMVAH